VPGAKPALNLVVLHGHPNHLAIWTIPGCGAPGFALKSLVSGSVLDICDVSSMAFLAAAAVPQPLLLVADIGSDSIHLIDVVREAHNGYFARPWSIKKPRNIAANKASTLVAISTWCIDLRLREGWDCNTAGERNGGRNGANHWDWASCDASQAFFQCRWNCHLRYGMGDVSCEYF
jgi:hypothetical protein